MTMPTRPLGTSGIELTTIGLGTWAIGGGDWAFGWGPQDERDAIAAIHEAVGAGVGWIDTAAVYGGGRSEELVRRALREIPANRRPLVATKCGRVIQPDGSVRGVLKRTSVRAECEASLARLGVDAIDLYQMHWPDPDADIEDAWDEMATLVREGKARAIGVSNCAVTHMRRLLPIHPIASLQPPYNMIVRHIEVETLEFCAANGIGVVAYSPMGKGLLTGAFSAERALSLGADDHRSRDPKFAAPQLELHLALVERIRPIAAAHDRSLAELAIAWVLRRPEITSAIVGARRPGQIAATAPAADWSLTSEEIATISGHLDEHARAMEAMGAKTGRV